MISVTKIFTFDAAHRLPYHDGPCCRLHGHTYKLEVTVSGLPIQVDPADPKSGMIIDFGDLKDIVNTAFLWDFDHGDLNVFFECPTAEEIVAWIFNMLAPLIAEYKCRIGLARLERVRLWETATSYAEVSRS